MSPTFYHRPCIGLLAASVCLTISAHETWIAPTERVVGARPSVSFDMSSGEHFPTMETAIDPERISTAACRQGTSRIPLLSSIKGVKSLRLNVELAPREGVTCWVQLKPRALDLSPAKVEEYLKEIDAPDSVRQAWQNMPEPKRWSETYTKNAKVVVPGTKIQPSGGTTASVGLKLEFVSESDLSTGVLKGPLRVTVMLDGKPLSGLAVALWSEAKSGPVWQTSDSGGRVSFARPSAGRWMVSGTELRAVDARVGTWESQFSTLVFEIIHP